MDKQNLLIKDACPYRLHMSRLQWGKYVFVEWWHVTCQFSSPINSSFCETLFSKACQHPINLITFSYFDTFISSLVLGPCQSTESWSTMSTETKRVREIKDKSWKKVYTIFTQFIFNIQERYSGASRCRTSYWRWGIYLRAWEARLRQGWALDPRGHGGAPGGRAAAAQGVPPRRGRRHAGNGDS